jgi:hypothetical protein
MNLSYMRTPQKKGIALSCFTFLAADDREQSHKQG